MSFPKTFDIEIDFELLIESGAYNQSKICPIATFCKTVLPECPNLVVGVDHIYTEGLDRIHQVTYKLSKPFTASMYNKVKNQGAKYTITAKMDRDEEYAKQYLQFKADYKNGLHS